MKTFQDYCLECSRTKAPCEDIEKDLLILAAGLCGESIEILDSIEESTEKTKKELGDTFWYLASMSSFLKLENIFWNGIELKKIPATWTSPATPIDLIKHTGTILERIKKYAAQGHDLNLIAMELDLMTCLNDLNCISKVLNSDLQEIAEINIAKLKARYPDKFSSGKSIKRED
ncbi:MAG: hypothetical protein AAF316_00020 [Cyanobacteria bacterium P01_A01_bin.80]